MTAKYPEAFIEQALVKVYSRGDRSVKSVAQDLNVNDHTLRYWMKNKVVTNNDALTAPEKPPVSDYLSGVFLNKLWSDFLL